LIVVSLSTNRRKWIVLVVFLVVVVLGFLGAIVFFFPPRKEYVVLREIPVTTYYTRTVTSTATLTRTVASSSASLFTAIETSFIPTVTLTRYDPRTLSWVATTTDTVVTVIGNATYTLLVRTLTHTYVFTTSVPLTDFIVIPTVITKTTTRWTSFNQTTAFTTTMTLTATSASTYTRTVWTTVTAPPGAAITLPNASNQARGYIELVLYSTLLAGVLVFRRRSISHSHVKEPI